MREKGVAFDVELPADFGTGWTDGPLIAATFREFDGAAAKMAAASEMYVSGARRREYRDYRLEWMIKSGGLVVVQARLEAHNIRFPWPGAMEVLAD
ncbi:MAG: hypothetical protein ACRYF2_06595 [Janthinobacterium lividum]